MDNVKEINESHSPTPTRSAFATQAPSSAVALSTIAKHKNNNDSIYYASNINIETQLLQREAQQQLHDLYATTLQQNIPTTTIASAKTTASFVTIPLSERPPLICITQQQQQQQQGQQRQRQRQQNGNNHHENYLNSNLTSSSSCLVRWRQFCLNFFTKIMGSNNPSEADRYEYYDCK